MLTISLDELILHAAILHRVPKEDTTQHLALIKHIISIAPETLELKTTEGWTPLQQAVWIGREDLVAYFISLGANQRHRDKIGRNMIHSMVTQKWAHDAKIKASELERLIDLFDREAVKAMLVERVTTDHGARTPLAMRMRGNSNHKSFDLIEVLTRYSSGEELEMIDGDGELPLHVVSTLFLSPLNCPYITHYED